MLSKSKYCRFIECPKKLWLTVNRPELACENTSMLTRMDNGNAVGDLAMGYFGDFSEVTALRNDGSLDLSAMIIRTNTLLAEGCDVICEASFSYNGDYCAVDILKRNGDGYAIYEVKSSTSKKDMYIIDIAYQKYILEHCGIKVTGVYLMVINNEYILNGKLDLHGLFRVIDVSTDIAQHYADVEGNLAAAHDLLEDPIEPAYGIGRSCLTKPECPFWEHCSAHLPQPSVFDLHGIDVNEKLRYYNSGTVSLKELSAVLPSKKRRTAMQIDHALNERDTYLDKAGIKKFLDTLFFPLYFLDFEAMQLAVPQFNGTKPYAQIPFQYSLHCIDSPEGELAHKEFLAEPGTDPRRAIAESLCENIPTNACIIVYSCAFEKTRIRELAAAFPDLAEHLLAIVANVRDIKIPFSSGLCYNRAMHGLSSLKIVLPALFPNDPSLDYHSLNRIQNGSDAMSVYPLMVNMSPEEQAVVREALLRYCELDTLATVKLWQFLCEAVKG